MLQYHSCVMLADMNVIHWEIEPNTHLPLKHQHLTMQRAEGHAIVGY